MEFSVFILSALILPVPRSGSQLLYLILYKDNFNILLFYTLSQVIILQAQADIVTKEIHSIDLDPSCQHQLAFHLDDGW